ncbi:MAG: tetratricopeptide repeat protein, partial [Planctomycetota bacterium]
MSNGILEDLVEARPRWAPAQVEHAIVLGSRGQGDAAIAALRRALAINAEHPEAWRLLGDHLMATGDTEGADAAYARHVKASTRDPRLLEAASALLRQDMPRAESLLKAQLREAPTDVAAIRMLAEVAVRLGRTADAERLLARCLALAPGFTAARYNYAVLLHRQNESGRALPEVERLVQDEPRNPGYRNLLAVVLGRVGEYTRASALYREILTEYPGNPKVWMSFGHLLKTEGLREECIAAYRKTLELQPSLGEAWWSLANMKTFRFSEEDLAGMRSLLEREDLGTEDRLHVHFSLGKAAEDAG